MVRKVFMSKIKTVSDAASLAVGTQYNNHIMIPNGIGDGENYVEIIPEEDNQRNMDDWEFLTMILSNGDMKIFTYDLPDKDTDFIKIPRGSYGIYRRENEDGVDFAFVFWNMDGVE